MTSYTLNFGEEEHSTMQLFDKPVTKTRDNIIIELQNKDLVVKIIRNDKVKNYHIENKKIKNNKNNYGCGLYNYYLDDINLTEKINMYTVIYNEIINQNDGKDTLPILNNDCVILYGKFCNGKNELKLVIPEDFEHNKENINRQVNKYYSKKCEV